MTPRTRLNDRSSLDIMTGPQTWVNYLQDKRITQRTQARKLDFPNLLRLTHLCKERITCIATTRGDIRTTCPDNNRP